MTKVQDTITRNSQLHISEKKSQLKAQKVRAESSLWWLPFVHESMEAHRGVWPFVILQQNGDKNCIILCSFRGLLMSLLGSDLLEGE